MSFFNTTPKKRTTKTEDTARPTGPKSKQEAATLNRLGCKACPLNNADVHSPKMLPTIPKETLVYFLAEAPGRVEDEEGAPLIGPSGQLVRECIPSKLEKFCAFDNVVRNRPPENRTPVWIEIECCRQNATTSIAKAKPKIIVGLGHIPLQWMLGINDMVGSRGRFFAVNVGGHQCWFLPTYHPAFVLRTSNDKKNPLRSRLGHCFRLDFRKVFDALNDDIRPPKIDTVAEAKADISIFDGTGKFDELEKKLLTATNADQSAIDLETQHLRPYKAGAKILTASISHWQGEDQVTFAFAWDHPKAGWTAEQRKRLGLLLLAYLKSPGTKIAHNVPFELEWLLNEFGSGIIDHDKWEDPMVQAQLIDERKGESRGENDRGATYQNLDFLCKQHFGLAIKSLFKLNKKNMEKEDLTETLIYNGVDTKFTLRLHNRQEKILKRLGLLDTFDDARDRQPTVAMMQFIGVDTNPEVSRKHQKDLAGDIEWIEAEINEMKVVKKYIADKGRPFNPASNDDVLEIFRDYLKRQEVVINTNDPTITFTADIASAFKAKQRENNKGFRFSVDKNTLDKIDHPLAEAIIVLRNKAKNKSTYVDGLLDDPTDDKKSDSKKVIYPDGLLHTSFNTTYAETGRLSSDEPNLQNWPKRTDAYLRDQIVPPKNHIFVAVDYGQLEFCTTAMCSKDKIIVDAIYHEYDVHMEWAQRIAHLYPEIIGGKENLTDNTVMKKFRSLVKNKMVFPAIFGAQNSSVAGYMKMPEEIIDKVMNEFWKQFSTLHSWQDDVVMSEFYEEGYVSTLGGRRRHYPLTRNQAVNHPIQGSAAEIVCRAMANLSRLAHESQNYSLHPLLNIHDDLTFAVPDDDQILEESIETIYRRMLTPGYKWINVPLSVEVSVGYDWYHMKEVGKFYSHKDV